jgi:hypothetical protein
MAYKQEAGRGQMMKTGRGAGIAALTNSGDPEKDKKKRVTVKFTGGGETWDGDVAEGSGHHKLSQDVGTVPDQLRNLPGVRKDTDPFLSGISPEEKKKRMDFWNNKQR